MWIEVAQEVSQGRLDFGERGGRLGGVMTTVLEIEAAIEKLPFEEQRELAVRLEERTRVAARARPEVKYVDKDTFEESLEFVLKRHAPLLRKLAE